MDAPLVSVVLPFHNAAQTLGESIDSIRTQSFPDWELILFDDGATDGSSEVAKEKMALDKRMRMIAAPHRGLVPALHDACAAALGQYIARMDADDVALPQRLQSQWALMEADPGLGLCGTQTGSLGIPTGPGRRRYENWGNSLISHDDITREIFVECPLAHPTFFLRRRAFVDAGGYQEKDWPEDYDLVMRLWLTGWHFAKVPAPLLLWRHSTHRLSIRDPRYADTAFREMKRHYLFQTCLAGRTHFHQWGAGEVGKRWLREWNNIRPHGVVDIDPRKLGKRIHGVPVIAREDLPAPGQTFIVVAVGARGARADIRAWLNPRGHRETIDYIFVA